MSAGRGRVGLSVAEADALVPADWRTWLARLEPEGGPSGATWVADLHHRLADLTTDWGLEVTGPAMTGWTAIVLPVIRAGQDYALKVVWPHLDAAGEPLALRLWAGNGAVRLIAADPGRGALLLERLDPSRTLADPGIDTDTACEVIGALLARLHVPAPPNLRTLADVMADRLDGEHGLAGAGGRLPRRAVDRALGLARALLGETSATATLTHMDLHFENVLAGSREPWLAIDPKPLAGHPGAELQPVMRNRAQELGTGSAFRWSVRRRLEIVCDAAGIDEESARHWTIVLSTVEANWAAREGTADAVSLHLALAKALDG